MYSREVSRRQFLRIAAGLTGAVVLAGCGANDPTPTATPTQAAPTATNVAPTATALAPAATATPAAPPTATVAQASTDLLRFIWSADSGNLTPFQVSVSGPGGPVLMSLVYDSLTWKDDKGIIPWLASEWNTTDGLTYTFKIRSGATWHDGKPLSADDVKFSYNYYKAHPYLWMPTTVISGAELVGSDGVKITLTKPYAAFLEDVAGILPIIPRHVWEPVADPLKYAEAAANTGSGPLMLVSHDQKAGAYKLVANSSYWAGKVRFGEWQQFTVPAEQRITVVQQGSAEVSLSADASVRDLLASDARLKVFETEPLSVVRLAINTKVAPLDRKEVRQAIAYALDRKTIAETITKGPAIVGSSGVVPPETPWFDPDLMQYDYNPDRARELLAGETVTIELLADATSREPDLMTPMLEAVGIKLNVKPVDSATRTQLLGSGDFQMGIVTHIGVGGDPDYLRRWYAGEEANAFARGSIFENAEYTDLGNQEAAALDPEARREIVYKMQAILADELPTVVLYYRRFYWVYDPAKFTPMNTWGGLMNGIPFPNNKLTLLAT